MLTSVDPAKIKADIEEAVNNTSVDAIPSIQSDIDTLVDNYEEQVSDLGQKVDDLQEKVDNLQSELDDREVYTDIEDYAGHILKDFTGTEPNLGDVLLLKEELTKLLVNKFNVSLGNL